MKRVGVLVAVVSVCTALLAGGATAAPVVANPSVERSTTSGSPPARASVDPRLRVGAQPVVRGRVPDDATVRAFARSNDDLRVGDTVESVELPVQVDEAAGRFEVRANARALPATFFAQGDVVDVQVVAEGADGTLWVEHTSAKAVRHDARVGWTSPLAAVARSGTRFGRLRGERYAAGGVAVGRLTEVPGSADAGRADARAGRAGTCNTQVIGRRRVRARIADTYPVGRTKAWVEVLHTNGGRYQYTMKVPKHPLKKMGMLHAGGSWGTISDKFRRAKKYTIAVRYRVVDNRFRRTNGLCDYYITHEPAVELGSMLDSNTKRPKGRKFRKCVNVSPGSTWIRFRSDGSPYRRSYGVSAGSLVGVNLAVEKNYRTSDHTLNYKIRGRKRMCGNNRTASLARRVMEKRRG